MDAPRTVFDKALAYLTEKNGGVEVRETHLYVYEDGDADIFFVAPIEENDLSDKKEPLPRANAICEDGKLWTRIRLCKESIAAIYRLLREYDRGTN